MWQEKKEKSEKTHLHAEENVANSPGKHARHDFFDGFGDFFFVFTDFLIFNAHVKLVGKSERKCSLFFFIILFFFWGGGGGVGREVSVLR